MSAEIVRQTIAEDEAVTVLLYVTGAAATAITQATISTITCKVFDLDSATPSTAVNTPAVVVASSVFDTLQTDYGWDTANGAGYNFRYTLPAAAFATGGHTYRAEFKFTPTSGDAWWRFVDIEVLEVLTS